MRKINISIENPCQENWDEMQPDQAGTRRFCANCRKNVVDFTLMSDRQIVDFFKKPSNQSACGRFLSDQLERDIILPNKRKPWFKYFFQIFIPAFFASSAPGQPSKEPFAIESVKSRIEPDCRSDDRESLISQIISGTVTDETGDWIAGASIKKKGTRTGVAADNQGDFKFLVSIGDILIVSGAGISTKEVQVQSFDKLTITVERTEVCGTSIVVVAGMPSIRRSRKPKELQLPAQKFNDISGKYFQIHPNPVTPSAHVTIEWKTIPPGEYTLDLVNEEGRILDRSLATIGQNSKSDFYSLPLIPSGIYYLVLTGKKDARRFTEKVLVRYGKNFNF
jgi:hypothetical protein